MYSQESFVEHMQGRYADAIVLTLELDLYSNRHPRRIPRGRSLLQITSD